MSIFENPKGNLYKLKLVMVQINAIYKVEEKQSNEKIRFNIKNICSQELRLG